MSEKILVVDDDALSRKNISQFLREEGYEVEEANNGKDASQLIEQDGFDLVLSDLVMPEGNGLYLIKRATSAAPRTPVLIMSGFPSIDMAEIVEMGASGFIRKPLVFQELLFKVKGALQLQLSSSTPSAISGI